MVKQTTFSLTGSNGKLILGDVTFDEKNPNTPTVLFVHGFKGFKDWGAHNLVARYFAMNGYRYAKFNLSHNGVPPENPADVTDMEAFADNTVSKELYDLDVIISFLLKNHSAEKKVSIIGHSRGGGLGIIQAANDSRIKNLITWASISDFRGLWKAEQEPEWQATGKIYVTNARTKEQMPLNKTLLQDLNENAERLNILNAAKRINIPWLLIHGEEDINVPLSVARQLTGLQPDSKLVKIENANHVFGASHPYPNETLPAHLLKACEKSIGFLKANN